MVLNGCLIPVRQPFLLSIKRLEYIDIPVRNNIIIPMNVELFPQQLKQINNQLSVLNDRVLRVEAEVVEINRNINDSIDVSIEFRDYVEDKFDEIDRRFDKVEERLDRIEGRVGRIEDRLDGLEERMDRLEAKMDNLEKLITEGLVKIKEKLNII